MNSGMRQILQFHSRFWKRNDFCSVPQHRCITSSPDIMMNNMEGSSQKFRTASQTSFSLFRPLSITSVTPSPHSLSLPNGGPSRVNLFMILCFCAWTTGRHSKKLLSEEGITGLLWVDRALKRSYSSLRLKRHPVSHIPIWQPPFSFYSTPPSRPWQRTIWLSCPQAKLSSTSPCWWLCIISRQKITSCSKMADPALLVFRGSKGEKRSVPIYMIGPCP